MYEVGQQLKIGYYDGFHHQTLIKAQAEVTKVSGRFIEIKVHLSRGGFRTMFGYENELKKLENNYYA